MGKIYFMSDSHLGIPDWKSSLIREKMLVRWLDMVAKDASEIYLLGDIFDFWFEYQTVVPKGFVRLLGKLAEISDSGIAVHYFTGNHDMWAFDYFESELGLHVHRHPIEVQSQGKLLYIAHGDGLGPGDIGYKIMKRIFSSKISQKLFSYIHPGIGTGLALFFSKRSRLANGDRDSYFRGEDKESLIAFSKEILKLKNIDYFIFGHRHYPILMEISPGVVFVNTGDWITHFSYAVLDHGVLSLRYFDKA
jgi:UDP-2,3-diacylglucosamine hydrolase